MLTEVGGKAVEAEEQVKLLRQRISEMEEQMKKTEEVYKEQVDFCFPKQLCYLVGTEEVFVQLDFSFFLQIKEQENKTHSNWVSYSFSPM